MHSRSIRSLVALLAALGGLTMLAPAAGAATVNAPVTIRESGYSPATVTIRPGERVIWFNGGTRDHTVTSDSGNQIASGTIAPGEELSIEFSQPGTYHYHSAFLRDHMRGTVVVAGARAAAVSTVTVTVDTAAPFPITISRSAQEALATSPLFVRRQDDGTWWSAGLIAVAGLTAAAVVIALLAFERRRPENDPA
jgi:plastocyanin